MKTLKEFLEARMVATGDFKISASGRKVRRLIKVGDDAYSKEKDIDNDGDNDANDEKAAKMRGESVEHIEEATVKSAKYSWGTMKTVHHGKDFSIPLHPEHHKPIAALKHGESHSFKDETGNKWKATREDDTVHFHGGSYGTQKTSVKHDTMKESVELDEDSHNKQDSRLMQLARLGLLDKNDVAIFRNAMQTFKADKQLSIKQRDMLLSVYNDLVNMVTGDDAMFARAKLDVQKEDTQLDEDSENGLAAKAKKSGVSLSTLKKVYARGVAAWNSGHRPGTTPQQWGYARVNSYITKGKGTYHGADKDLREGGEPTEFDVNEIEEACWDTHKQVGMKKKGDKMVPNCVPKNEETVQEDARMDKSAYHKGMSDSMKAARVAHWKKMDKKSDSDPSAYEPAPGDATAKTKPSVHTKKYHDMYGESVEQIDEISKETLASYIPKAAKDARIHGQIATDFENRGKTARKPGSKDSWNRLSMKYKEKAWKRDDGISKAVNKLTKEETQSEGYYKDIDTNAKEDERLGSWKKETPWRKIKPGSDTVTDKSGAIHTPMSKVRHLARLALKKTTSK